MRLRSLQTAAVAGLFFAAVGCSEPVDEDPSARGDDTADDDEADDDDDTDTSDSDAPPKDTKTPPKDTQPTPKADGGKAPAPAADAGARPAATPDASTGAGDKLPSGTTWCAARAVLQTRCQTCHGVEPEGASFSLVTWEDTQANSSVDETKKIADLIKVRIHDAKKPMPPVAKGPLTSSEMAALDAWIAAGYPNGSCTTPETPTTKPSDEFAWPAECTPDKIFKVQAQQGGQPYKVQADWEDNVAITVPVPWAGKVSGNVQAVAIKPLSTNKKVVHHWILYAGTSQFITSWSPGKEAEIFPDDIGVYMPTSGSFRLNMHYYNKGGAAADDSSGAEICITNKLRPKTATTNMFGPIALSVPPGKSEAVSTCTHNGSMPVTIITSSPHMHKTGVGGKLEVIRANGMVEVIDDSPFDQEDQSVKPVNVVVNRGDKVRTTCRFDNTSGRPKRFGESTEDEMCFNFARYYPMGALQCSSLGF
jgi:mono/diheme cytochrome c family protein